MAPENPYSVEGIIKTAGVIRVGITVYVENRTTAGYGFAYTDAEGHYLYDDIQDSDVLAVAGDTIRIYTSDSGETYTEFTVSATPEEKVVDMDYILHPRPIAPYSIEGTVKYYGVVQSNLTVTIRNITKGFYTTCTTDADGHYFYDNIRDSVLQVVAGETVHVSVPSGAGEAFVAVETEERVVNLIDLVMWGALWQVRITPTPGTAYVGNFGSYTFQSDDDILGPVSMTFQNGGMSSFDVTIINDSGAYNDVFAVGNIVEIWMDSELGIVGTTKRLTGNVKTITRSVGSADGAGGVVKNLLVLKGFDYIDIFKHTTVNEVYKGARTYEDIITNDEDGLLHKYAPAIGGSGVQVTNKSITSSETLLFSNITLYECLVRIQEIVGDWIFYINPDGVLCFEPAGTTDNNKTLYEFGDVDFEENDANMANSVTVVGGSVLNPQSKVGWIGTASENATNAYRAFDTRT